MALYPCSMHGARFRGTANHWYGFVSQLDSTQRYHLRLCAQDHEALEELVQQELAEVSNDESVPYPEITDCFSCKAPIEDRYAVVIMTGYRGKEDKRQWMAGLHPSCSVPAWLGQALQGGAQAA